MWKWVLASVMLAGVGYVSYDYYRGGFVSAPALQDGDFLLSYKSGLRAVMRGFGERQQDRRYLGYPSPDVPSWYDETWSICRKPSAQELESFEANSDLGPGIRLDAVCEIDADGDVFVRGWIASVPDLE
jgi:hypothetical protein